MENKELRQELEAIASQELRDVLDSWGALSEDQAARLASYLRSELAPHGMLSVEKARENGESLTVQRRQARRMI